MNEGRSVGAEIPWLTLLLVAGCIAVTTLDLSSARSLRAELDVRLEEAVEYFESRPYLEPPPVLAEHIGEGPILQRRRVFEQARRRRSAPPIPAAVERRGQERLEGLVDEALAAFSSRAVQDWGVRSSAREASTLFGHALFHSSWLHLLGACAFLVVLGIHLEAAWGRFLYGLFLLGAAPTAALSFSWASPAEEALFVGSSGVLAALLGAFAVRFRRDGHDGVWGLVLVGGGLWLVLPVWLGIEWSLTSGIEPGPLRFAEPGPSYWAFAGGAGYGVLAACAIALFRFEEAFLGPSRDARRTQLSKTILEMALAEREAGHPQRAFATLSRCLKRHPDDCDVALALWDVAHQLGRSSEAVPAMLLVIRDELRRRDEASAVDHWLELEASGLAAGADLNLLIRISTLLRRFGKSGAALDALRSALDLAGGSATVASRVAREARELDAETAEQAAWRALGCVELDYEERHALEAMLGELQQQRGEVVEARRPALPIVEPTPGVATDGAPIPIELGTASRPLELREVRPLELREDGLAVELEDRTKELVDLDEVEALAVGAVSDLGERPVILVDLVLNWMTPVDESLRVLRMRSDGFDPRRLIIGEKSPADALRRFVTRVLQRSDAVPLPDQRSVLGQPFASFDRLADYERAVLLIDEASSDSPHPR